MPNDRIGFSADLPMNRILWRHHSKERGQGMLEYGIVMSVIALVVIGVVQVIGHKTSLAFCAAESGLGNAGALAGWGDNTFGQLGNGNIGTSGASPASINGDCSVSADSGTNHVIIVKPDLSVWAWGANQHGAVGIVGGGNVGSPTAITADFPAGSKVIQVAAGTDTSYALMADGTLYAWGTNANGAIGNAALGNTGPDILSPVPVCAVGVALGTSCTVAGANILTGVTKISAGNNTAYALVSSGCAVAGQCYVAWGAGASHGQLGNGANADSSVPVRINTGVNLTDIAGGQDHGIALTSTGNVIAWGAGTYGVLGDGFVADSNIPVYVQQIGGGANLSSVKGIGKGATSTTEYAFLQDGSLVAWGQNQYAQIGNNTQSAMAGCQCASLYPVQVLDTTGGAGTKLQPVTAVARGNNFAIAILGGGTEVAWGQNNASDQLGQGGASGGCGCLAYPTVVPGVTLAMGVAAGAGHVITLIGPNGTPGAS